MTVRRATFRWPPAPRSPAAPDPRPLAERLREEVEDRCQPAAVLVARASRLTWEWVRQQPPGWGWAPAAGELERGLADWLAAHGWRGPAALWIDTLRRTFERARAAGATDPRQALLEELAQWTALEHEPADEEPWDGQPLTRGRRLPRRMELARAAAAALQAGEIVVVPGFSETVALALGEARRRDLDPRACVPVGGPDQGGLRLARRLAADGVRVRVVPDGALADELERADRVWTGTEAIGAGAFLGPVGLGRLLEEARRRELPVEGLATRDKLVPGGAVEPAARPDEEAWLLWNDAPAGVELDGRLLERVPLELVDAWWTELGSERARELCLRALRSEAAEPLAAPPR